MAKISTLGRDSKEELSQMIKKKETIKVKS